MNEPGDGARSAGALLRAARERQGLHIAALAAAIKVAPRKLDALENDRWDELPDATFTRALAQTVCRTLKIDSRPVLDLLPRPGNVVLEAGHGGLNAPFHDPADRSNVAGLAGVAIRPMVWAVLSLLLAALAVYLLPAGVLTRKAEPQRQAASAADVPLAAPAPASVPMLADAADAAASAASATFAAAADAAASGPASLAAVPAMPAAPVAAAPPAALPAALPALRADAGPAIAQAQAAPPPTGLAAAAAAAAVASEAAPGAPRLVQLRASDSSWVEVRDGGDRVLLTRTLGPGESVGVDGSPPLRLIIGNAAATELAFRGRPVDLGPRTRDNVARLELP